MKFNKKLFWRTLTILLIFEATFLLTGCGDWESQAINIISLLNPAIVALLNILAALGVAVSSNFLTAYNNWATQAQDALAEVKALIQQYKTAAAADQPGILNSIQTALATLVSNLQTVLPMLHIDNPANQQRVTAALNAIIGFVTAIQNLMPSLKPTLSESEAKELHLKATTASDVFKKEFNNAVEPFGKQYTI